MVYDETCEIDGRSLVLVAAGLAAGALLLAGFAGLVPVQTGRPGPGLVLAGAGLAAGALRRLGLFGRAVLLRG